MREQERAANWLAERIAAIRFETLEPPTVRAARRCIVDVLGCAAAGRQAPAVRAATAWAHSVYPDGASGIWFTGERIRAVGAAFVNASAASILDLDDGHRVAAGHPGAAIVPVVLAQAQEQSASFDDIVLAIVAGYEAGVLAARMRSATALSNVATGRWSTIGVAAALAKLMRFDAERTRHALTIAESYAPNLLAADHSGFQGGHVKEGIPWSVVSGFAAAGLAREGFRGYDASFSNPAMYGSLRGDEHALRPLVESTYYKLYGCCRWIHSAIDAAVQLHSRVPPSEGVQSIRIETFERAATLPNATRPNDLIAAQFSVPFMVAAAWLRGPAALLPVDEVLLTDGDVVAMAERITIAVVPEYERLYPLKVPARVTVSTARGEHQHTVVSPLGDHDNPLSDQALVDKALHLSRGAGSALPDVWLGRIVTGDIAAADLFSGLAVPV